MSEAAYLRALTGEERYARRDRGSSIATSAASQLSASGLQAELYRAGIPLSVPSYIAVCSTIGFLLFLLAVDTGPVFALFLGIVAAFELSVSLPKERARIHEQRVSEHLPRCLEVIGRRISSGEPFENALITSIQSLPDGPLVDELEGLLHRVQAGGSFRDLLLEFPRRVPGVEARFFAASLHLYSSGQHQSGDCLVQISRFMGEYNRATERIARRVVHARRVIGGLSIVLTIFALALMQEPAVGSNAMLRELGAILLVAMVVFVHRSCCARWWEGDRD